jgi:hypothetical protein
MEKYQKTWEQVLPLLKQMRGECIEFLTNVLDKNPDGIDLQQFEKDGGDSVCVTYDGGNHPEYASNAFSQVYMVKKDGTGSIIFETEDADIDIDYLETLEIASVCDVISQTTNISHFQIDENATISTCHNGMVVNDTTEGLTKKLGLKPNYYEPDDYGEKTTREWDLILQDGTPFTIYDWKEYRVYDDDETIEWHIGTRNKEEQEKVRKALSDIDIK